MNDALDAATDGPQTDTLGEQVEIPKPQNNQMPEDAEAPKAEADDKKSSEEKRSDSVKRAIDKALDEKPEDKAAAEAKAKEKAEAKEKLKAEKDAKADPKAKDAAEKPEADADDTEEDAEAEAKPAKASAYKEPPSGFDEAAKKEWEAVPESVRGAVHRRSQEMERGIHKYRQFAENYDKNFREFDDLAKQHGVEAKSALKEYVRLDQKLKSDMLGGLQDIVAAQGIRKPDGSTVTLRDVAAHIMGQKPDQVASRQEATISQLTQQVQSLSQQLGGFSEHVEQQKTQERTSSAENEWGAFQNENPRAKELEPQIAEFLTKYPADNMPVRERLQDAYNWAVSQNPSVAHTDAEPLVQTQPQPKAANPAGQKSISGAGGNKAKASSRKLNRHEAIEKAMRSAGI